MKFGTFHLFQQAPGTSQETIYAHAIEQITTAEKYGFDSCWLAEHHFSPYGICPDPLLMAAHLAGVTERVRLGIAVSVLPFSNPVRLAERASMVDRLSGGRLDLGVGRGYQAHEFKGFGISMDDSKGLFDESLAILRAAWQRKEFSFEGKHYKYQNIRIFPDPVQEPHPPIWIGAWKTPATVEFAAKAGFPIMSPVQAPLPVVRENLKRYKDIRASLGLSEQIDLPVLMFCHVGPTDQKAKEDAREAIIWYLKAISKIGTPKQDDGSLSKQYQSYSDWEFYDWAAENYDFVSSTLIIGSPETCIERIQMLQREIGLNYLILWKDFGGLAHEKVMSSLELFATKVMPAFKASASVT